MVPRAVVELHTYGDEVAARTGSASAHARAHCRRQAPGLGMPQAQVALVACLAVAEVRVDCLSAVTLGRQFNPPLR